MKKILFAALCLLAMNTAAQQQGKFEAYNYNGLRVHVYYTNNALGDASYIIEGRDGVVTLEEPIFKANAAEFGSYLQSIGKPVDARIVDYHIGSTGSNPVIKAHGMDKFMSEGAYAAMISGFQKNFGDALVALPTGKASEAAFGSTEELAGISFKFQHGASSDFPAADILIGNTAYYSHWAPVRAHVSSLYASSPEAIDARITELQQALASGAQLFIGGHGGAATASDAAYRLKYLQNIRQLLKDKATPEDFAAALKKAYPELKDSEGNVDGLAKALYANK